jgi:diguanylate cyclase (GGDEF)-like protein
MKFTNLLSKIKAFQHIDDSVVQGLYALSTRSFLVNIALAILVTIALYPIIHFQILIWFMVLFIFVMYRLYTTYRFNKNPNLYTMSHWYKIFLVSAILTATIYSSLGFFFLHALEPYYQLFVVSVLLGLSSGSAFALSQDVRLSIVYMGILLIPLIITLLFLPDMPLHTILFMALFIYLMAQMTIIYKINTQKKQIDSLESRHTLLHSLFKNAPLGIFTYTKDLEVIDCNAELGNLFNHELKSIIGMNLNDLPDSRPLSIFKNSLVQGSASYEGPYVSLQGDHFWIEAKAFPFTDKINSTFGGIGIIEDKTKEHTALQKLEYLVEHDVLTGLLNRRGFTNYIEGLVHNIHHEKYYSILFYLDLNQFKAINDSLGHAVGDEVLLAVSKRLLNVLDKGCMVSRLGGDEFIIMVPHTSVDIKEANLEAQRCAEEIQNVFLDSFIIKEMHLHVQASIGIVLVEPKYTNTEEILRYADLTMYQAKSANNHISYYDPSLDEKQKDLFMLQHNLAYAAENNQLELFFQPIVKMKNESLLSAELLIRWVHPTRGMLSPEEFIPLAIKAGLLSKITWWLLDSVCQQIAQWKKDGQWKLEYISININPQQLIENHFATEFFQKLKSYSIKTNEIMLEITERSLIDNFANTQGVINDLKSHGVKCAIDDFGIGYSSLSYLKKLSFHTLKIDRTFVKDIGQSPKELVLINTILEIGRQFGYNIVIEGIDNEQQKRSLLELDKELSYQGYFYSKPIKADEFTKKFLI